MAQDAGPSRNQDGPCPPSFPVTMDLSTSSEAHVDHILFGGDRIYPHNIMRINYTTYDVRRGQDTINPSTSHRDVMVLADDGDGRTIHHFLFARVLGIYHANVIYTGPGATSYSPRRMEFLWVRWYERLTEGSWNTFTLERLGFPSMANEDSFGFLDPSDVVRSCHITPAFWTGMRHRDRQGLSRCVRDSQDWHNYYVNRCAVPLTIARETTKLKVRFVDRDMLIRFHPGLGVGHVYAHPTAPITVSLETMRENRPHAHDHGNIRTVHADSLDLEQNGPDAINSAAHPVNVDSEPEEDEDEDEDEDDMDEWGDVGDDVNDDELSDADSVLVGFGEMYGDDVVEMDYEN